MINPTEAAKTKETPRRAGEHRNITQQAGRLILQARYRGGRGKAGDTRDRGRMEYIWNRNTEDRSSEKVDGDRLKNAEV